MAKFICLFCILPPVWTLARTPLHPVQCRLLFIPLNFDFLLFLRPGRFRVKHFTRTQPNHIRISMETETGAHSFIFAIVSCSRLELEYRMAGIADVLMWTHRTTIYRCARHPYNRTRARPLFAHSADGAPATKPITRRFVFEKMHTTLLRAHNGNEKEYALLR